MKVSVIIPFHKVEAYTESCIQSIIDQTYNNIELILVNDKSPDKSLHLAKEVILLNAFRDVTIIEHAENRGVSAARNTGLAAATGDFVLFVDSDDTLEPTMLEEMTNIVNKHNVDIAICNVWRIHTKDSQQQNAWKSALTGLVDSNTAVEAILDFREKACVWKKFPRESLCLEEFIYKIFI